MSLRRAPTAMRTPISRVRSREDAGGLLDRRADLRVVAHVEVAPPMPALQQPADGGRRRLHAHSVGHAHGNAGHMALPQHARHGGGVGHPDLQQRGIAHGAGLLLHHAHHPHRNVAEQQGLADRVFLCGEEPCPCIGVDYHHLLVAGDGGLGKEAALPELQAVHAEILLTHALHLHVGRAVAALGGATAGDAGRGAVHERLRGQCRAPEPG
ncbi:hypothetical protein G6F35_014454 [Rhizopus arrhizus]|nr:hypothetical protein G6F35_014454 [Rhizopus arrhizus]